MNFKKPKYEVLNEAHSAAWGAINSALNGRLGSDPGPQSTRYAMEQAIADGIREAISSLMDNIYTDQEFEEDLKLR